jgi:hypothetical protein
MKMQVRGLKEVERLLTQTVTTSVRKGQRSGLNVAGTQIVKAQRNAVPPAKTGGRTTESVKRSLGRKVFVRQGKLVLKSGVGVGKKRGTYRPTAVFLAAGTVDRWTGTITRRNRKGVVTSRKSTGNAVRFTGRVRKSDFVRRGYMAVRGSIKALMVNKVKQTLARDTARRAGVR